jgi:C4-dicarboxylate-specific signal transduction histidine kinase
VYKTIPVCSLVQSALLLTEHRIRKCKIEVENNCQPDVLISTSANHLEQVMINLILNGIDAIEERKSRTENLQGKLFFNVSSDGTKTEIKVKDNGTGIPENIITKIFDPFFTTKELGKGTGLGLYVSYNIIRDLGGTMKVESKMEEGSEFIITFTNY